MLFLTECDYFRQAAGWAIRSPVEALLAKVSTSQFDGKNSSNQRFSFRSVDDIMKTLRKGEEFQLLGFVNTMHQKLKFTVEVKDSMHDIYFLDLKLSRNYGRIKS